MPFILPAPGAGSTWSALPWPSISMCFVLVVQSFEKVPALRAMAPTQSEPPFKIAQVIVLVVFIVLGVFAVKKFHPERAQAA